MRTLKSLVLALVLVTLTTGCATATFSMSGPFINRHDMVVVTNNIVYPFDLFVEGRMVAKDVEVGAIGRVYFPGSYGMIITARAYQLDKDGRKMYIGIAERRFSYSNYGSQSWIVDHVQRPRGY